MGGMQIFSFDCLVIREDFEFIFGGEWVVIGDIIFFIFGSEWVEKKTETDTRRHRESERNGDVTGTEIDGRRQ